MGPYLHTLSVGVTLLSDILFTVAIPREQQCGSDIQVHCDFTFGDFKG